MDSEISQWLREHYRPAPSDDPVAKKQKFEEIQRGLTSEFPSTEIQPATLSHTIKSVFPDTISKPAGKSRQKHIFGLEAISVGSASTSSTTTDLDLTAELRKEREEKERLLQSEDLGREGSTTRARADTSTFTTIS